MEELLEVSLNLVPIPLMDFIPNPEELAPFLTLIEGKFWSEEEDDSDSLKDYLKTLDRIINYSRTLEADVGKYQLVGYPSKGVIQEKAMKVDIAKYAQTILFGGGGNYNVKLKR